MSDLRRRSLIVFLIGHIDQDIKIVKEDVPLGEPLSYNVFRGTLVELLPLTDVVLAWFRRQGTGGESDLELRLPAHIAARYRLRPGRELQVALWEPAILTYPADA